MYKNKRISTNLQIICHACSLTSFWAGLCKTELLAKLPQGSAEDADQQLESTRSQTMMLEDARVFFSLEGVCALDLDLYSAVRVCLV
jgi:hypothetical protein